MRAGPNSERALILAPAGRDARVAADLLAEAGLPSVVCPDIPFLLEQMNAGAGLAVVVDDALFSADLKALAAWIAGQPSWSDFPFVVLARGGVGPERNAGTGRLSSILGNVLFVERPFHPTSLISLVQSALRARRRQYEARARIEDLRDSQERLRFAQEAGKIGAFELLPESGMLKVTPEFCRLWGLPVTAEMLLSEAFEVVLPEDRPHLKTDVPNLVDGALGYVEYRIVRPSDGQVRWIARQGEPMPDVQSGTTRYFGVTYDITERKAAEAALRESRDQLETETRALEVLNRTAAVVAADLDLDAVVQSVVDAGVELTGAAFGAFFYNVEDSRGGSYMLYALAGADPSQFDFGMPRSTAVFSPTFNGEGVVRSPDITADPRYGQNAPHAGMPKGHLPVRSYLAVPVVSRSGEVTGGLFFGHPETDVFGERSERVLQGLAAHAATAIDNARLFGAVQHANEQLESRVEERTRELDRLWRTSQDLLAVVSPNGVFQAVNPAWERILGYGSDDLVGRPMEQFIAPEDVEPSRAAHQAATRGEGLNQFENRFRSKAGGFRWFSWTAASDENGQVYANGRHVTAEREAKEALLAAEEALRQAQKMEAVGQLTGGIAHDFNNLLQGIMGSLDLVQRRIAQGRTADLDRFVSGAMTSANRAAALTHRLLAFSRRQPLDPRPVEVNPLVGSIEDLLRRTLGERITLELVLGSNIWLTLCDPNQLESAILNLCINARDAMPDGGRLSVSTTNADLRCASDAEARGIKPGGYVCVSVTDTGAGMASDVLARAFDPFFTTKPLGQGTGLGLSMIYGFARQSEGYARIDSEVGKGTTVTLYLPRYDGPRAEAIEPHDGEEPSEAHRGETVLVVEDEAVVRALIVDVLQELGYRALEAEDGPQGSEILRSDARIDLLVTDIGLPGINGRQLADAARVQRPGLRVLLMTGYAETAALAGGFLEPGMQLITKPFALEALAAKLRDMIEGG